MTQSEVVRLKNEHYVALAKERAYMCSDEYLSKQAEVLARQKTEELVRQQVADEKNRPSAAVLAELSEMDAEIVKSGWVFTANPNIFNEMVKLVQA